MNEAEPIIGARAQREKTDGDKADDAAKKGTSAGRYTAEHVAELIRRRKVDSEVAGRNVRISSSGEE